MVRLRVKPIKKNEIEFSCNELDLLIEMAGCNSPYVCAQYDDWEDKMKMCLEICKKLNTLYKRFCKESEEENKEDELSEDNEESEEKKS